MSSEYVFNRNERKQRYKKKNNFKNTERIEYIKEKKEMQREMQRRKEKLKGKTPNASEDEEINGWHVSPKPSYHQSTRCK